MLTFEIMSSVDDFEHINHEVRNKRKMGTPTKEVQRITSKSDEKFYLKKLSSDEMAKLLQESSDEECLSDSDVEEEDSECWAVSNSPRKRIRYNSGPGASNKQDKKLEKLVVSPVTLKRKSEVSKIKIAAERKIEVEGQAVKNERNEKDVLMQIQNSTELDRKTKKSLMVTEKEPTNSAPSSPRKPSYKSSSLSHTFQRKKNLSKKSDSDSELSIDSIENFDSARNGSRTPRKIIKVSTNDVDSPKRLTVELARIDSKVLEILTHDPKDDDESKKCSLKTSRDVDEDDYELAFPLKSIGKSLTPSQSKVLKNKISSKPNFSHSEKSDSSDFSNDEFKEDDEKSLEKESTNRRTSIRVNVRKEEKLKQEALVNSLSKTRKSLRIKSQSPAASPSGRGGLRKRSEIKPPWYEDFHFETTNKSPRKSSLNSPKTSKSETSTKDKISDVEGIPSPRISERIQRRDLAKKEETSESTQKERNKSEATVVTPSRRSTTRSSNLSPLVDSVERISLRNRSEVKPPWSDDFDFGDANKRYLSVQSPRTPSESLRKQVLESTTTRSAKKKLYMESESSDSEDDIVLTKRSTRNRRSDKTSSTPSKTQLTSSNTPSKTTPSKSTPKKSTTDKISPSTPCTPKTVRRLGQGFLTPVVEDRCLPYRQPSRCSLEEVRVRLHISTVPTSLPCRRDEFNKIRSFLSAKLADKIGGCMYISGVPGSGKTATVHAVVKTLQQEAINRKISPFDFVEVNGLRLTEARQAYVRIWQHLSGTKSSADQAFHSLDKKFSSKPSRPTILLVDELDYVCNRRQDVVYNMLDWSTRKNSRLTVLTIANTMDLPERTLKGRVTSRMGLTRLVFQPYSFQQLQEIVMDRLKGTSSFDPDAVQFVARKVAAVSGDARRALDICRRSMELLEPSEKQVTLEHVDKILSQIFLSRRVQAIKHCSYMGQLLLRAIRDETLRTGVEESILKDVYLHLCSICNLEGSWVPTAGEALSLCRCLSSCGLLAVEKGRQDILSKLTLNVSSDDIHYALSC